MLDLATSPQTPNPQPSIIELLFTEWTLLRERASDIEGVDDAVGEAAIEIAQHIHSKPIGSFRDLEICIALIHH